MSKPSPSPKSCIWSTNKYKSTGDLLKSVPGKREKVRPHLPVSAPTATLSSINVSAPQTGGVTPGANVVQQHTLHLRPAPIFVERQETGVDVNARRCNRSILGSTADTHGFVVPDQRAVEKGPSCPPRLAKENRPSAPAAWVVL